MAQRRNVAEAVASYEMIHADVNVAPRRDAGDAQRRRRRGAAAAAEARPSPQNFFRTAALEDPSAARYPADERNKTKQRRLIVATTQEGVQISAIVPTLTVDDLQKSIAFYEALGFAIDERWEEQGTLLGVMLRAGNSQIGLNQDDWKKGRDRKKGIGVRLSLSTPGSVDEIAKRAKNTGITLKSEPRDTEWKSRAFEVIDPSGFLLTIFSGASA
jgi:uncharacterized glyoxalase superfamily protein PhnB